MVTHPWYWIFFALLGLQRLAEVWISRKNSAWMRAHGGHESGAETFKIAVSVSVVFFLGIPIEAAIRKTQIVPYWPVLFAVCVIAQAVRVWTMRALGRYWNVRVWTIPGGTLITKGPYRWLRHPNYLAVIAEMIAVPWIIQAYATGILCLLAYLFFLKRRLAEEEAALRQDLGAD
jgi:methyltransferase